MRRGIPPLLLIAARNLLRQVRHSAFALAAIAFGVAGLALADGFVRDVFFQLGEATARTELGHLQIARPGLRNGAGRPEAYLIPDPIQLRQALAGDTRVEAVRGRLQWSGVMSAGKRELPVEIEGTEPLPESASAGYLSLLEGVGLKQVGPSSVLLGEGVARQLGIGPGAYVNLTASTIDGAVNSVELKAAGIFRTFSKEFDDRVVQLPLLEAQQLLQLTGVNALLVHLHETADTDLVLARLRGLPALRDLEVLPWYELSDFYRATRELYARQFGILRLIALALIAMSVLTTFNITIFERTAEFGTMRALGAHSRGVIQVILLEAAWLGIAGALLGILIAIVAGSLISWLGIPMPPPPNAESGFVARILLAPSALLYAAAIGSCAAVVGALIPSLRAARTPIVEALGHRI